MAENGTMEKDINLAIARKCEAFAGLFGLRTMLTREDENSIDYDPEQTIHANKVADIHARARITNSVSNPIFLSIHLNKFSDASYSGAGRLSEAPCAVYYRRLPAIRRAILNIREKRGKNKKFFPLIAFILPQNRKFFKSCNTSPDAV